MGVSPRILLLHNVATPNYWGVTEIGSVRGNEKDPLRFTEIIRKEIQ